MDGRTYPFLELAALPAVGALILDTRAVFVFSADGRHILFANAAGAAFLEEPRMADVLARTFAAGSPFARHLARLAKLLPSETSRVEMLRFNLGGGPVALPAACRRLNLADGGRAVLAVAAGEPARESLVARAEKLADALGSRACLAAIIAPDGRVLAASGGFDDVTPASAAIDALVEEAGASERRLVKRALPIDGASRPAGVVRFEAGTQALRLLLVGPEEDATAAVAAPETAPEAVAEPVVAEADVPLAGPLEEPPPVAERPAVEPMAAAAPVPEAPVSAPAVRFLWQMDRDTRFTFVSGELAAVVGEANAAIAGRTWDDVAGHLGLDPDGGIAEALARHASWSGLVGWPIAERAERVTVDLTGFVATGLDRSFDGYRGVGSIRPDAREAIAAPVVLDAPAAGPAVATVAGVERAVEGAPLEVPEAGEPAPTEPVAAPPAVPEEAIEEAVEGAPLETAPPPTEAPEEPEVPAEALPPPEEEIERATEGAPIEEPQALATAPVPPRRPPLVLSEEDIDDAARRIVEEGGLPSATAGGPVELVEAPTNDDEAPALPPAAAASEAPSNVVRLPAQPARILPERLTGSEQDAFRRIAEALGARMSAEREAEEDDLGLLPLDLAAPAPGPAPAVAGEVDTRVLDKLPAGLVIYRERRTLFANRALLDMLGYASLDAFAAAGGAEAVFPDPNDGGPRAAFAEDGGPLLALRADGGTVPVDARLHAVPWAGATALMLSLIRRPEAKAEPVTDQALLDHLIAAERRIDELQAILDTATDGIVVIDEDGRIDNINRSAEALFGVEATDVLRQPFTDLLAEESRRAALDYLDGLAENGVASVLNDGREVIGKVPKGGLIPMFMTMGRLGDAPKFCAVLRDITHWKNVEEELVAAKRSAETANSQKSEFLARISHEIRTPLNAIIGFSEVMMEERFGPVGSQRYRDYLHDIHVSGTHMLSLINDLLDLSKIEAGKMELAFESVAVNETIQECVALMQPQANRERIIIRTSLSAEVPNVVADQRSLRQILLNLLSNAVKFTGAGGQVIVATALEDNGEVTLRIRDTGIGMSEKDIETAMKPFRQVGQKARGRGEGTGLGLPLTKALVEANRATFAIDSAPNQGTLVKITFPTTRVLAG
ncbi:MAG: PAS domain S-box protein [Rhizobiales bacterium]|nr:PAS domain S-box protein [Hyphomicrobiales bacterium]